ncbi:metallophosphoesterase, partial [bacterium]
MHRTVKNCISILRASSKMGNEYSPINRTKLLEIILSGVFQDYEMPTYNDKKPDVKDCSFVLGYFCESLVLRGDFEFSSEYFKNVLTKFCDDNYIELDLNYLLNVLIDNSIIGVKNLNTSYFKNSYWVFYFIL